MSSIRVGTKRALCICAKSPSLTPAERKPEPNRLARLESTGSLMAGSHE